MFVWKPICANICKTHYTLHTFLFFLFLQLSFRKNGKCRIWFSLLAAFCVFTLHLLKLSEPCFAVCSGTGLPAVKVKQIVALINWLPQMTKERERNNNERKPSHYYDPFDSCFSNWPCPIVKLRQDCFILQLSSKWRAQFHYFRPLPFHVEVFLR